MIPIPDPLHPAVIHFPIVLILLGATVSILAIGMKRGSFFSALLLTLGAIGAFVAVETGEESRELAGKLTGAALELVDSHEEWAERTQIAAAVAALLAILAAVSESRRWGQYFQGHSLFRPLGHVFRICAGIVALVSCFLVAQTAHRGGRLVYDYGVGINAELRPGP